jgi:hypothetical protein
LICINEQPFCLNSQSSRFAFSFSPAEHRNMPYEDAMKLIARNFETYMQEMREKAARAPAAVISAARPGLPPVRAAPLAVVAAPAPKPEFVLPDSDTHYLLNLLADNRYLALDELDKVLRYLDLRYERLARQQGVPDRRGKMLLCYLECM